MFSDMLAFSPGATSTPEEIAAAERARAAGWVTETFRTIVSSNQGNPAALADAIKLGSDAGSLVIEHKDKVSSEALANDLVQLIESSTKITDVKLLDNYTSVYGDNMIYLQIKGTSYSEPSSIFLNYFDIMRRVNFIDNDVSQVFKLKSKTVSENQLYYSELVRDSFKAFVASKKEFAVVCDGAVSFIKKDVETDIKKFSGCRDSVSISLSGLNNIVSLVNYNYKNEFAAPIRPFAVTSLVATFVMYYIAFAYLVMSPARRLAEFVFMSTLIETHPVSAIWIYTVAILSPLIAAAYWVKDSILTLT